MVEKQLGGGGLHHKTRRRHTRIPRKTRSNKPQNRNIKTRHNVYHKTARNRTVKKN